MQSWNAICQTGPFEDRRWKDIYSESYYLKDATKLENKET